MMEKAHTQQTTPAQYREFGWDDEAPRHSTTYVWPAVAKAIRPAPGMRVLDVGCGNGSLTRELVRAGCSVVGIDLSAQGIAVARRAIPEARFEVLAANQAILENLAAEPFDVVVATELIEHLYDPRDFLQGCLAALRPSGQIALSTPYHGYIKNVAVAVAGKFDYHVHPWRVGGHIKFFSRRTLSRLLVDEGFVEPAFRGAGRLPWLWKSMVVSAYKPRQ
jgi:ubiquinone biosynthesis O-methyltransferase